MGTPNSKLEGTPMGRPVGKPNNTPPELLSPKKEEEFCNNDPKQVRNKLQLEIQLVQVVSLQLSTILLHKWHTKTGMAHQDESAFRSQLKMTKIEEVYPDKIGTIKNVQVLVKPNQDVSCKSKLPMSVAGQENVQEDLDEENDEDDD